MKKSISYFIDEDVKDWLAKYAEKESRSASAQLNKILRDMMKCKKK